MSWYILEINPEPWAVGPVQVYRKGAKIGGTVGRNQQLAAYQEAIKEALADYDIEPIEGEVDLTMFFWRHRAEYETHQARTHRKHEADGTNLFKATEDALQGVLFKNDRDVKHGDWWIMKQGPNVIGKTVIKCEPCHSSIELPTAVVRELNTINKGAQQPSSQAWGSKDKAIPF